MKKGPRFRGDDALSNLKLAPLRQRTFLKVQAQFTGTNTKVHKLSQTYNITIISTSDVEKSLIFRLGLPETVLLAVILAPLGAKAGCKGPDPQK